MIAFWKGVSSVTQVRRASEAVGGQGILVNSLRADLSFSISSPGSRAWLTVCRMNGSRVKKGGLSHRAPNMSAYLHVRNGALSGYPAWCKLCNRKS